MFLAGTDFGAGPHFEGCSHALFGASDGPSLQPTLGPCGGGGAAVGSDAGVLLLHHGQHDPGINVATAAGHLYQQRRRLDQQSGPKQPGAATLPPLAPAAPAGLALHGSCSTTTLGSNLTSLYGKLRTNVLQPAPVAAPGGAASSGLAAASAAAAHTSGPGSCNSVPASQHLAALLCRLTPAPSLCASSSIGTSSSNSTTTSGSSHTSSIIGSAASTISAVALCRPAADGNAGRQGRAQSLVLQHTASTNSGDAARASADALSERASGQLQHIPGSSSAASAPEVELLLQQLQLSASGLAAAPQLPSTAYQATLPGTGALDCSRSSSGSGGAAPKPMPAAAGMPAGAAASCLPAGSTPAAMAHTGFFYHRGAEQQQQCSATATAAMLQPPHACHPQPQHQQHHHHHQHAATPASSTMMLREPAPPLLGPGSSSCSCSSSSASGTIAGGSRARTSGSGGCCQCALQLAGFGSMHAQPDPVSGPALQAAPGQLGSVSGAGAGAADDACGNTGSGGAAGCSSAGGGKRGVHSAGPQHNSLYKTEFCRSWLETGHCRYASRCQFAHGAHELRQVQRHPKYKTQLCRTFATQGSCPYGDRCHFIHDLAPHVTVLQQSIAGVAPCAAGAAGGVMLELFGIGGSSCSGLSSTLQAAGVGVGTASLSDAGMCGAGLGFAAECGGVGDSGGAFGALGAEHARAGIDAFAAAPAAVATSAARQGGTSLGTAQACDMTLLQAFVHTLFSKGLP